MFKNDEDEYNLYAYVNKSTNVKIPVNRNAVELKMLNVIQIGHVMYNKVIGQEEAIYYNEILEKPRLETEGGEEGGQYIDVDFVSDVRNEVMGHIFDAVETTFDLDDGDVLAGAD